MKKTKKSLWPGFKLRAQLFRIWFMKNILVWVQIFCITCFVCILTGNISADTPVLGKFIYPLFKPLVDEIVLVVEDKKIDNLMDFFAVTISILMSIGVATMKLHRIAQNDIKNDNLKIALIQANLYFNSDGRLVKKTEKMVGRDLDGDGKISDTNETPLRIGPIRGLFYAIKEFFTIATVDLSGTEEESEEKYEDFLEEQNLKEREKGAKEVKKTLKKGVKLMALDGIENEVDKKMDATKNAPIEERAKKVSLFTNLKNKIKAKKKEVEAESTDDVIVNNMEKDAKVEKKQKKSAAVEKAENIVKQTPAPTPKTTSYSGSARKAADILAELTK